GTLMEFILRIRERFSLTVLLIEHQMRLVMGICERFEVAPILRALSGVVHPSAGSIVHDGKSIAGLPSHRIACLGDVEG
ncbi:MAG: hypothetical protein WBN64_04275, partial [Candidatus Deferrimicrobium sp.]